MEKVNVVQGSEEVQDNAFLGIYRTEEWQMKETDPSIV